MGRVFCTFRSQTLIDIGLPITFSGTIHIGTYHQLMRFYGYETIFND